MTSYRQWDLGDLVRAVLADMPVVVVTGLRQAGKSTYLRQEPRLGERQYVSLDEFPRLEAARRDPYAFVRQAAPLTIDEVQRCPDRTSYVTCRAKAATSASSPP